MYNKPANTCVRLIKWVIVESASGVCNEVKLASDATDNFVSAPFIALVWASHSKSSGISPAAMKKEVY
jgi:hypothetical protein